MGDFTGQCRSAVGQKASARSGQARLAVSLTDPSIHEDCLELLRERLPLDRRYRHSDEGAENAVAHLAGTAIYLSSRAGAYLTGAVIPVDGGISTRHQ